MNSDRAELARRILSILAKGDSVPFRDAIQLRNWAIRPEEAMLSLEEIADGILKQENPNEPGGNRALCLLGLNSCGSTCRKWCRCYRRASGVV